MTEISDNLQPSLWPDINNATSLPVSADGHLPSQPQGGPLSAKFGPQVAPANLFRAPVGGGDLLTSETSGLTFSKTLSKSESLKLSLASRLLPRLDCFGSIEYTLTWKARVTPSRRSIFALRASRRRISDSDCIGWPTVCHEEDTSEIDPEKWQEQKTARRKRVKELQKQGLLSPGSGRGTTLAAAAALAGNVAGWCTPSSRDWKDTPGMSLESKNPDGSVRKRVDQLPRQAAVVMGWATPNAWDCQGATGGGQGRSLRTDAKITGYLTPVASDCKGPQGKQKHLSNEVLKLNGEQHLQPGQITPRGALNPEFCRWLMGFPAEWGRYAVTATRLSRRSPQSL